MDCASLFEQARRLGFGDVGLCSVSGFAAQKRVIEGQPALSERRQLRFFPEEDHPWARALVVLLWPYAPASLPGGPDEVFIDSYYFASNAAYHAAKQLEAWICAQGYQAKANVSYPAKEAALRAGLGVVGQHSLLIHPKFGTRIVVILMATDAVSACEPDIITRGACLKCGSCVAACPAGAIDERGMSHPERCLRNFMLEGVVVPNAVREKMGMKLVGCDACQRACPMQPAGDEAAGETVLLDDFMVEDEAAFRAAVSRLGDKIGRNAARPQRVRAQAALLAGNRKSRQDLPVLMKWAQSDFEAVRVHAAWATERVSSTTLGLDQTSEKR